MSLTLAVWLVILGALVLSNLPFLLDRPLAFWPWGRSFRSLGGLSRWLMGLAFIAMLALWSWGTLRLVGGAFGGIGNLLFVAKLLISLFLAALLMLVPGWLADDPGSAAQAAVQKPGSAAAPRPRPAAKVSKNSIKPFIDRFLEALVGYVMVGTVGFALELDLGNAFPQGWEFYAVTLALFLVLGYPGFVWCYLLQRRMRR